MEEVAAIGTRDSGAGRSVTIASRSRRVERLVGHQVRPLRISALKESERQIRHELKRGGASRRQEGAGSLEQVDRRRGVAPPERPTTGRGEQTARAVSQY